MSQNRLTGSFFLYVPHREQFTIWTSGFTFKELGWPHGQWSVLGEFTCDQSCKRREIRVGGIHG